MNISKRILASLGLLFFVTGCTQSDTAFSEKFTYRGNVVSPGCFYWFDGDYVPGTHHKKIVTAVDMESCSLNYSDLRNINGIVTRTDGAVGSDHHYINDHDVGYVYYTYLGKVEDKSAVLLETGKGARHLYNVILVEFDDDTLVLSKRVVSGQQCKAGHVRASVKEGRVAFDRVSKFPKCSNQVNKKRGAR